jgi:hypothetical protein
MMDTETAIKNFKPGVYKHFKGGLDLALFLVSDCEDPQKKLVVYISMYENPNGQIWVRPVEDFMGEKELEDGTKIRRFEFIKEEK